ncbi:MAG: PAS domain-containing protein [Afipia sp.]|nr:PAS domain-containing protein [Afipia sp.]
MGAPSVVGLDPAAPFESANPAVVKSIKQRDLLNTWLRLYAKDERLPKFDDYQPERMSEELPDIVYYTVDGTGPEPRFIIDSDGTRMSNAYGTTGKGRFLVDYLGPKLAPIVIPIYQECVRRRLPIYTTSKVDDLYGRKVDYERLLMPFSEGAGVNRIIASLKTISDEGGFEIRNLMRANDVLPIYTFKSVIDRDLYHKRPGKIAPGDVIEFG